MQPSVVELGRCYDAVEWLLIDEDLREIHCWQRYSLMQYITEGRHAIEETVLAYLLQILRQRYQ